ncbi:hypothetical protein BH09BAC1_BH09BAC1_19550 [soil metagenome]
MQVNRRTIRQMKLRMKAYFPGEYALVVTERLRQQGFKVTIQQVYNFFNNVPVSKREEILNTTIIILREVRERQRQIDEILKEELA